MAENAQFLTDEEFASLPSDAFEAAEVICERWGPFRKLVENTGDKLQFYERCIWWFALGQVLVESYQPDFGFKAPGLGADINKNIGSIIQFLNRIEQHSNEGLVKRRSDSKAEDFRVQIAAAMGQRAAFVFTDDDLDRMQNLINELRSLISKSSDIPDKHKQRLLKRLEQLQAAVHKTVSDLDRAIGVILELSAAVGKAGENLEPLADRISEMSEIIVRVISTAQGFPAPLLPPNLLPTRQAQRQLSGATEEVEPKVSQST